MNRTGLAAGRNAGLERQQQASSKMVAGMVTESGNHGTGYLGICKQVARCNAIETLADSVDSQDPRAGKTCGGSIRRNHGQLAIGHVISSTGDRIEGFTRARSHLQPIQNRRPKRGIGDVLRHDCADVRAGMRTTRTDTDRRRGDDQPEHAGPLASARE